MKFVKKPIPVQVEFVTEPAGIQTMEGEVQCIPGDALMTGALGEHWPIGRARFEATYEPVPPTRMGEQGEYLKKPIPVDAQQAEVETEIVLTDAQGTLVARPGDWVITDQDDHRWVVADEVFRMTYDKVE